jgi:hypothetical protein
VYVASIHVLVAATPELVKSIVVMYTKKVAANPNTMVKQRQSHARKRVKRRLTVALIAVVKSVIAFSNHVVTRVRHFVTQVVSDCVQKVYAGKK